MDSTENHVQGPIRDSAAALAQIADAATTAAAAIATTADAMAAVGRMADATTALLTRAEHLAGTAETFATKYVSSLAPLFDALVKMLP